MCLYALECVNLEKKMLAKWSKLTRDLTQAHKTFIGAIEVSIGENSFYDENIKISTNLEFVFT